MMRRLAALFVALALAGCAGGLPFVPDDVVLTRVEVDQTAALAIINRYRAAHGVAPLALSADLKVVAQDMADHIAGRDRLKSPQHSAGGLFARLKARGVRHDAAAENLGYGYATLEKAFAGWRGSPGHDRNLLNPNVTEMAVARTNRADGKWRNFWALIMVRPES